MAMNFTDLYSNHTCLAVINLNSALKKDDNYYPCKHIQKKVVRHIRDNLSDFSYSSDACVSKNIEHYFSNRECTQKICVVFKNYVHNTLKHTKLCLQCIKIN